MSETKNSPKAANGSATTKTSTPILPRGRFDYYEKPVEAHEVPCKVCGSKDWTDWLLLPHKLFNEVRGYLCFPCFVAEWVRLGKPLTSEHQTSQRTSTKADHKEKI